ncbi:MAG TPA: chloride channel protein [Polyangia bacterium]|jgi:CIC family chloride channel protein|nr:chloride channel protein [Polyangia bacterium]
MKRVVGRELLTSILREATPQDLRIVGRTLTHAAIVGAAAGLMGAAFFATLELVQRLVLEDLGGYRPLRASGETFLPELGHVAHFRPWLLVLLPAAGALAAGIFSQLAPETYGGGGDAMIDAFHHQGGMIRKRVSWVKAIASILTLGTGGSGGREGPTMQIGGALGSLCARLLKVDLAERRILMVAGVAAGIAAVFRTPLGAALLAVEVLYRDDFESDALIPAVLASVTAYSVVISIFGETTLFAHPGRFPFIIKHLWLYGVLALFVSMLAVLFVTTLRGVQKMTDGLTIPMWARPGLGGLAVGVFCVPIIVFVGWRLAQPGQGLGLLGGGYGAVQVAITGASWLPLGWTGAALLLLLCLAKILSSSLTIGSGGSAGDFAPAMVIGGLFGGAFGRVAQLLLHDPRIDPGAFALVAMGTFYGGISHTPLSSLVLVCELAGSYDLLVPLMLAEGIAFVALRKRSLYSAQLPTQHESPVHKTAIVDVLTTTRVGAIMRMISVSGIPIAAREFSVRSDANLRAAAETMLSNKLREIQVTDAEGHVVGLLDEADISRFYLDVGQGPGPASARSPTEP